MSEFVKELIPVIVMYGIVSLLAPLVAWSTWLCLAGDKMREEEAAKRVAAREKVVEDSIAA